MPGDGAGAGHLPRWLRRLVGRLTDNHMTEGCWCVPRRFRREEEVAWWQKPCDYCGGMVGNHTSAQIIDCQRDLQAKEARYAD